jgi:hypothetical protein
MSIGFLVPLGTWWTDEANCRRQHFAGALLADVF